MVERLLELGLSGGNLNTARMHGLGGNSNCALVFQEEHSSLVILAIRNYNGSAWTEVS